VALRFRRLGRTRFDDYARAEDGAASAIYTPPVLDSDDAQFACAMLDRLRTDRPNVCFGPFSIRAIFALCYAGARGRTSDEIRDTFRFRDPAETTQQFTTLLRALTQRGADGSPPVREWARVLGFANRLWGATGYRLLADFVRTAADGFGAPLEQLDFAHHPEASRSRINAWVEDVTEKRVIDLIARGHLDSTTTLVATSATYLRAQWADKFPEKLTGPAPFFTPRGRIDVPMMEQTARHAYGRFKGAQVVELSYVGGQLAMRVAIPGDVTGLAEMESAASEVLTMPLKSARIHLSLPRFRCESTVGLERLLPTMGLTSAFRSGEADFSGIDGTRLLFLSTVTHKAFVDVHEKGTEAAAATALMMRIGASIQTEPPIEVRVDRPFLFWIVDRPTGCILFGGRVVDPSDRGG
jgi:serpin B